MKKLFSLLSLLLVGATALTLTAQDNPCGVEGVVIEASNFQYSPSTLDIEVGQTVVWVNTGGTHDVNASMSTIGEMWDNPEFFTLPAVSGNSEGVCIGSHTFTVEGTYDYDCSIGNHAANGMVATVTVNPTTQSNTVVDIIVNSEDHTLLEAAVLEADLAGALSGDGPFTVFAPTDDAVTALVTALGITAEELLALPNLAEILQYHVVAATAMAADLSDGQMITTLLGQDVEVTIGDAGVFINNAQVTAADITADNGVVHVIDAVLVPAPPQTTVVDIIVNSQSHTVLEAAVISADLAGTLSGDGPFTVFAPTDDAFATLLEALGYTAEELLAYPGLTDILLHHVVAGTAMAADLSDGQMITTLLGQDVTVTINEMGVFINNSMVTVADIVADNGVVHVIDAVLVPAPAQTTTVVDIIFESEVHTMLEDALIATDLVGALSGEGPFTVFAPTDEAHMALMAALGITLEELLAYEGLTDVLLGHVVEALALSTDLADGQEITTMLGADVLVTITGDGVFINQAQVIVADLVADNGVVHVIDAVLIPEDDEELPETVVDIIVESEVHTLLELAVGAAGLVDALSGEGPFTVFAPTDDAVVALTAALGITAEELLALPNLGEILQYHVVAAEAYSDDLSDGQTLTTLEGSDVTVSISDAGVMINEAMVIIADLEADNGVVHVIDAVLIPTVTNVLETATIEFSVYPNPASNGVLNVQGAWGSNAAIQIWNAAGQLVQTEQTTQNQHVISTEGLSSGLYTVRVLSGTNSGQKMFLVD
ncbi:MAG: T9SS type A sorting domain-containing protein [Crocinitomicaceae bacterium]|nr:T9SS type A sorting domain-containing protein [Crocinitomicaceae bacterium]MDB4494116.1 fasciclin domain-containing protein [Flavobacteriales bacterium]